MTKRRRTRVCPHYKELYMAETKKTKVLADHLLQIQKSSPTNVSTISKDPESERFELTPISFYTITGQTEKAWAVCFTDYDSEVEWFPKSQCAVVGTNTLMAPRWLLEDKGLKI